jgi:hypothetical protein
LGDTLSAFRIHENEKTEKSTAEANSTGESHAAAPCMCMCIHSPWCENKRYTTEKNKKKHGKNKRKKVSESPKQADPSIRIPKLQNSTTVYPESSQHRQCCEYAVMTTALSVFGDTRKYGVVDKCRGVLVISAPFSEQWRVHFFLVSKFFFFFFFLLFFFFFLRIDF